MATDATLDKIVSLCKRRGFVYQSADIYGGLTGIYDFGHLGTLLKENLRYEWRKSVSHAPGKTLFMEGALIGPSALWKASGHIENFHDPMIDCYECKHRYREDDINLEKGCPHCGKKNWSPVRQFNMMFKTHVGATEEQASIAYLRPETAQAIFANVKNMISTNRVKLPFGIAQIGKAFRNEITPKQFLFRMREFEQMELEWFCKQENAQKFFEYWKKARLEFYYSIGITKNKLRLRPHEENELAHYSTACTDVEYEYPFGWKELEGIAHRGNFDLTQHTKFSGKDLSLYDEATKSSIVPDVVECSVGADRLFLTVLFDAYKEEEIDGETRVVLNLSPKIAPIKAAFLPLTKKQRKPMFELFEKIQKLGIIVQFDESGSIGKRYRRNDEIGTPYCFTYDFDSENDKKVTVRDRTTTKQERIDINNIASFLQEKIK